LTKAKFSDIISKNKKLSKVFVMTDKSLSKSKNLIRSITIVGVMSAIAAGLMF